MLNAVLFSMLFTEVTGHDKGIDNLGMQKRPTKGCFHNGVFYDVGRKTGAFVLFIHARHFTFLRQNE